MGFVFCALEPSHRTAGRASRSHCHALNLEKSPISRATNPLNIGGINMKFVSTQLSYFFSDKQVQRNVRALMKYVSFVMIVVVVVQPELGVALCHLFPCLPTSTVSVLDIVMSVHICIRTMFHFSSIGVPSPWCIFSTARRRAVLPSTDQAQKP